MPHPERPRTGIVPFLAIRDGRAAEALAFYAAAFGAEEVERNLAPDGRRLMQASMTINGGWIMLADEFPEWSGTAPVPPADPKDARDPVLPPRPRLRAGGARPAR